jgi:hypothetical protein
MPMTVIPLLAVAGIGTASLLSMIGTGTANAGVSAADQANSVSANESLQQDTKIPPTLTPIKVSQLWFLWRKI